MGTLDVPNDKDPVADLAAAPLPPPRPSVLGGYAWFDIATRLILLALGLLHLAGGLEPVAAFAPVTLLGAYLAATLLSIAGAVPALRYTLAARGVWRRLTTGEHLALTFLVDSAFVIGVAALGMRGEASLLLGMVV